jgi:hypothetical protein
LRLEDTGEFGLTWEPDAPNRETEFIQSIITNLRRLGAWLRVWAQRVRADLAPSEPEPFRLQDTSAGSVVLTSSNYRGSHRQPSRWAERRRRRAVAAATLQRAKEDDLCRLTSAIADLWRATAIEQEALRGINQRWRYTTAA